MISKLEYLIRTQKFNEAKGLLNGLSFSDLEDTLMEVCYKTENIIFYSFIYDMIKENESALLHYIASTILSQPLCHIEGAYQAAFYHAKMAVELDEVNVELKEYLLFFNEIPDQLLDKKEAKLLAEQILKLKPYSEVAKKFI